MISRNDRPAVRKAAFENISTAVWNTSTQRVLDGLHADMIATAVSAQLAAPSTLDVAETPAA